MRAFVYRKFIENKLNGANTDFLMRLGEVTQWRDTTVGKVSNWPLLFLQKHSLNTCMQTKITESPPNPIFPSLQAQDQ